MLAIRHVACAAFFLSLCQAQASENVASEIEPGLFLLKSGAIAMAPIPNDPVETKAEAAAATGGDEQHCLATAIYFEARGESAKGQKAVAEVILARTRAPGRPRTICGVVYEGSERRTGCQFSFTCDGASDVARDDAAWARAKTIAAGVMRTGGRGRKASRGATFYHADHVRPYWASGMVKVARIGSHIFYRPKRGS